MMAAAEISLLDDRALTDRARRGDDAAFEELHRRLAPTVWRFANAVCRDPAVAAGATVAAFASTLNAASPATDVPIRVELLSAARHAAFDPSLQPVAVELRDAPAAASTVGQAFSSLPERWRSALWLLEAERLTTEETGPALGVPAESVGSLKMRGHAGLADRVVGVYAAGTDRDACRQATSSLLAYSTDRLSAREAAKVRRHLDGCDHCQDLLADLDDLAPSLRLLALPLPAGLLAISESRWRQSLVRASGPLGLTLPSGQPVPPWAERAVAGAAAAVVALGISAAVLVAGRGGKVRDDGLARSAAAEEPLNAGDGESALGGSIGLDDGLSDLPTVPAAPLGAFAPSADPTRSAPPPASVAPTVITPTPVAPAPAPAPAPVEPAEPAVEVTVAVDGVLGVTVGDQCTGVEIAGTVIGCAPAATDEPDEPVEVITGGALLDSLGL